MQQHQGKKATGRPRTVQTTPNEEGVEEFVIGGRSASNAPQPAAGFQGFKEIKDTPIFGSAIRKGQEVLNGSRFIGTSVFQMRQYRAVKIKFVYGNPR